MTEMTSYPPIATSWQQDGTDTPGPVLVAVAGPAVQRRVTVATRLILAVPHLLALSFLGIAAVPVAVIGWLGALVTGRLPRFAAAYLSGYLRWYARAGAYLLLLTDEYPPFALRGAAYPVRLAVGSGKLNRLTVLFRVILAIPVAIVSMLVNSGLAVIVVVAGWPAALIAGRLPGPLHQAFAAVLRYAIRYLGYLYLLTGAYPAGMFGDEPAPQPAAWGQAGAYGQDGNWRLALSPGARRLVRLILVLGLLSAAGEGAWAGATISAARQRDREISQLNLAVARFNPVVTRHNAAVISEQQAASRVSKTSEVLSNAHDTLVAALNSPAANSNNCTTVSCFNATSWPCVKGFAAFGHTLGETAVPPGSAAIAKRLITETAGSEQYYREMTVATSFTGIEDEATAAEKVGGQFDSDYQSLITSLGNELTTLSNQAVTLNNAAATLNQQGAALSRQAAALNVPVSVRAANPGS
jgi:Domain of unknown function (DUF4389)